MPVASTDSDCNPLDRKRVKSFYITLIANTKDHCNPLATKRIRPNDFAPVAKTDDDCNSLATKRIRFNDFKSIDPHIKVPTPPPLPPYPRCLVSDSAHPSDGHKNKHRGIPSPTPPLPYPHPPSQLTTFFLFPASRCTRRITFDFHRYSTLVFTFVLPISVSFSSNFQILKRKILATNT